MSKKEEKLKAIVAASPKPNIYKCSCEHSFQDSKYGKGMRVFTPGKQSRTCTVCGNSVKF